MALSWRQLGRIRLRQHADAVAEARLLAQNARLEEALQAYDRAFRVTRTPDPGLYLERGELKARLARFGPAIEDLSRGLEAGLAGEQRRRALLMRAKAKSAAGDAAGGLKDLDLAAESGPDPMVLLVRGQARLSLGDASGAAEDAERVLALDPSSGEGARLKQEALKAGAKRRS